MYGIEGINETMVRETAFLGGEGRHYYVPGRGDFVWKLFSGSVDTF